MSRTDAASEEADGAAASSAGAEAVPDPLSLDQRARLEDARGHKAEGARRYAEAEEHFVRAAELRIAEAGEAPGELGEYALRQIAEEFHNAAMNAGVAGHSASSENLYTAALESIESAIAQSGTPNSAAARRVLRADVELALACRHALGELALDRAREASESEAAAALQQADDHYRALYDAAVAAQETGYAGRALEGLAIVRGLAGSEDPLPYLEQAADAFEANGSGPLEVEARWRMAAWAYEHGDADTAFDECQHAMSVRKRTKDDTATDALYSAFEARCAHLLAALASDRGDDAAARQWLEEAVALFEHAGDDRSAEELGAQLSALVDEPDASDSDGKATANMTEEP